MMDDKKCVVKITDDQDISVLEYNTQRDLFDIAKDAIDCDWIDVVYPEYLPAEYVLLIDEEGKFREGTLSINSVASDLIGPDRYNDPIIGNAVIVRADPDHFSLLTREEADRLAHTLKLMRDLTPIQIADAYFAQQAAQYPNRSSDTLAQSVEKEAPVKVIVPCNVEIKRYYRSYVLMDEGASNEEVLKAMKQDILENGESELTPDPDMDIEEDDIIAIYPDFDAMWIEEEEVDVQIVPEDSPSETKPTNKKDTHIDR